MVQYKTLVIGAGEIGTAVRKLLAQAGVASVAIWDRDESKVTSYRPLPDLVQEADVVFFCIPSWAVEGVLNNIRAFLKQDAIIVILSKGLTQKDGKTMNAVLSQWIPRDRYAFLGGPMLAEELLSGKPGFGVVASSSKSVFKKVDALFSSSNLHLEYLEDINGAVLAGVLKNIYAIALGIVDGLDLGGNTKGWIVKVALEEMEEIVKNLGGKKETAYKTVGIGDLVSTGFSPYSSNFQVGRMLARSSNSTKLKSEGLVSVLPLKTLLGKEGKRFSLLQAVIEVVQGKDARAIFEKFIKEK